VAAKRTVKGVPQSPGKSEDHDAWTFQRMRRQSTPPPVVTARAAPRAPAEPDAAASVPSGGAFDLVERSQPSQQLHLVDEMEELYALDDLTGALRCAEMILGRDPDDVQARHCADNCRRRLMHLYGSKIGDLGAVPTAVLNETELRWLGLDRRSASLLSRIDGTSDVEAVIEASGMSRLEAMRTLVDLLDRGAVRVGPK
jgi:hypothetical protein